MHQNSAFSDQKQIRGSFDK